MNGYYRHIEACNSRIEEPFVAWRIDDHIVGWVRPAFVQQLSRYPETFTCEDDGLYMAPALRGFEERTAALADTARAMAADKLIPPVMGEMYAVTRESRDRALCLIDRVAASYLGVRSFGQHLNGFVRREDGIHMWIGRRAWDRQLFPGKLDNMVAGGLPFSLSLRENLVKECAEEAAVPQALVEKALPVGAISYSRVAPRGLRRDVLFCYDLELPDDFQPRNTDGEVAEFMLLPLAEVAAIVHDTDEFKLNCNLVVIDFLIRHGMLDPQSAEYLPLVLGLRQPLAAVESRINPAS